MFSGSICTGLVSWITRQDCPCAFHIVSVPPQLRLAGPLRYYITTRFRCAASGEHQAARPAVEVAEWVGIHDVVTQLETEVVLA